MYVHSPFTSDLVLPTTEKNISLSTVFDSYSLSVWQLFGAEQEV